MLKTVAALAFLLLTLNGCSSDTGCSNCQDVDVPPLDTVDGPEALDGGADGQVADVPAETVEWPEPTFLWPGENPQPEWAPWFAGHPWIAEAFSTWSYEVESGPSAPHFRYLPDHAVGNGHAFTLLGYTYPLNTLHSANGPYYHKGERFFSDVHLEVAIGADGAPLKWQRQGSGKLTSAPIAVTWAEAPQAVLQTVDFAPLAHAAADPSQRALVRIAIVHNPGANPIKGLYLRAVTAGLQTVDGEHLVESVENRTRTLAFLEETEVEPSANGLVLPLDMIPAGGERVVILVQVFDDQTGQHPATFESLENEGVETLLETTHDEWAARLVGATTLTTPDERVNDYLISQLLVVLSQQAHNGSSHPMSEYTRTWLRDNAGPARLLLRVGLYDAVRAQLDYLRLATLVEGGIANSYFGNFQPEEAGPEPDWATMPVMTGRPRAESPSYLPLMYSWYRRASGQEDFVEECFDWLRFALEGQMFAGELLPFSTDETFRTAMAVAHGLPVEESFEEGFHSANSSFLWVAAAERLAELAEVAGKSAEAAELRERADAVRAAANETFLGDDGVYTPYVYSEDLSPAPAPFEDVNTKPIWCGFLAPDDPVALSNLAGTMEALSHEAGFLVSLLPEDAANLYGLPIEVGIHTGMSPGYFLQNLAATNHPDGEAAFNALAVHATASATTPEYQILDDHKPLHFVYDAMGTIGDYSARYRPWEGGIVADAAWAYLLGNQADAPANTLRLAPHLPNGWSWLEARGVRVGKARVDVRVERLDGQWRVKLSNPVATQGITFEVVLPEAAGEAECTLGGEPFDCQ